MTTTRRNRSLVDILEEQERDIKRLRQALARIGNPGVTDHGALTGLGDDDHTQYHTDARGDARYYTQSQVDDLLEPYRLGGHVDFLTSGNFDPDDYPGLRAVRFLANGAGGAGGGASSTGSGNASCGGGGAGGTYGETGIITVSTLLTLDDPVEIVIGAAGTHNSGASGSDGGATVVGPSGSPIISCPGGGGGTILTAGSTVSGANGGASGGAATGSDVAFFAQGSQGDHGMRLSGVAAQGGAGGGSFFGNGAGSRWTSGAGEASSGRGRGGGSGGAVNGQNQGGARSGGIASDGRVVVELYY